MKYPIDTARENDPGYIFEFQDERYIVTSAQKAKKLCKGDNNTCTTHARANGWCRRHDANVKRKNDNDIWIGNILHRENGRRYKKMPKGNLKALCKGNENTCEKIVSSAGFCKSCIKIYDNDN